MDHGLPAEATSRFGNYIAHLCRCDWTYIRSFISLGFCTRDQPISSRIAFFTLLGTGAYFNGSITLLARPVLMERNSVV